MSTKKCSVCGRELRRGVPYIAHMRSHAKYGEVKEREIVKYDGKTEHIFYRT